MAWLEKTQSHVYHIAFATAEGNSKSHFALAMPTRRMFGCTPVDENILLTGFPGCGKTTLIERVIQRFGDQRQRAFYTRELGGTDGRRVDFELCCFEAIGVRSGRTNLAHVRSKSRIRVGRYGVEPQGFEKLINDELASDANVDLFVVDEIGKMECSSRRFVEMMQHLLDGDRPVLATVALKGGGFIQQVKERTDVELISVSAHNRDGLVETLVELIRRNRHANTKNKLP